MRRLLLFIAASLLATGCANFTSSAYCAEHDGGCTDAPNPSTGGGAGGGDTGAGGGGGGGGGGGTGVGGGAGGGGGAVPNCTVQGPEVCGSGVDENCNGVVDCEGQAIRQFDFSAVNSFNPLGTQFSAVGLIPSGGVYLGGMFDGTMNLSGAVLPSNGNEDALLARLEDDGSLRWARTFGDGNLQMLNALAVDPAGNVFVGGNFQGTVVFDAGALPPLSTTPVSNTDGYLVAWAPDGTPLWTQDFGDVGTGSAVQMVSRVVRLPSGQLAVAGTFASAMFVGGQNMTAAGTTDAFLALLSADGGITSLADIGANPMATVKGSVSPRALLLSPQGELSLIVSTDQSLSTVDAGAPAAPGAQQMAWLRFKTTPFLQFLGGKYVGVDLGAIAAAYTPAGDLFIASTPTSAASSTMPADSACAAFGSPDAGLVLSRYSPNAVCASRSVFPVAAMQAVPVPSFSPTAMAFAADQLFMTATIAGDVAIGGSSLRSSGPGSIGALLTFTDAGIALTAEGTLDGGLFLPGLTMADDRGYASGTWTSRTAHFPGTAADAGPSLDGGPPVGGVLVRLNGAAVVP